MKKRSRIPAVLGVSLLLIAALAAGSFYSRSLSLFAYTGIAIAVAFSALPQITNLHGTHNPEFNRAQFKAIFIDSLVLVILSFLIIYKAVINLSLSQQINIALACWVAFAGFACFIACAVILFPEIKTDKNYKILFYKYLFSSFASFFVIIGTVIYYLKDMFFLDCAVSMFLTVFILAQALVLIRKSFKILKKKSE